MPPRPYDAPKRRSATDATRAKILEATRALVGGKAEPGAFSMEMVARRAGVSRMTVYNQFGSQTGLLEALADQIAERGGMGRLAGAFMEPRPAEAVRKFVATFVGFWASDRLVLRRLRAMGLLDAAMSRGVRDRDAWRHDASRNLIGKLGSPTIADQPGGAAWAVELLTTMTSFEVFDAISDDKHPPEAVARSLADSLVQLWALEPAGRSAVGPVPPPTRRRSRRRGPNDRVSTSKD